MGSLYDIMGVNSDATPEDLKKAYRSKAGKCHPDKNDGDPKSNAEFQKLQNAYSVLKDPAKRLRYDKTGSETDEVSEEEIANNMIADIYISLASEEHFKADDYFLAVLKKIQNALRQCQKNKTLTEKHIDGLKYLIDNTAAAESLLHAIGGKLRAMESELEHLQHGVKVMSLAIDILSDIHYTGVKVSEFQTPAPGARPWDLEPDPYYS